MPTEPRIPVLIMRDAKERACVSIEPSSQEDGSIRLFKEFSSTSFSSDSATTEKVGKFLSSIGADRVIFEDGRKAQLSKLLKKSGYRRVKTYEAMRGAKVTWLSWDGSIPAGVGLFGIADGWRPPTDRSFRRMRLSGRDGPVGEFFITDFGRFARAKANEFGSEGFGFVHEGKSQSQLLSMLATEFLNEGKRYLILGPEYSEFVRPVHPFPIWHMGTRSQKTHGHSCRFATGTDMNKLAKLVSEYEDIDMATALSSVTKSYFNPAYRFLLPPDEGGFALLRFMEGAQGMINDLYVTPSNQGRGIGDELTRASMDVLSESCLSIRLNTIYPRAKRLYEKYGFGVIYQDHCVALKQSTMVAAK